MSVFQDFLEGHVYFGISIVSILSECKEFTFLYFKLL